MNITQKAAVLVAASLAAVGVEAANYTILNVSTLNDVRKIGGQNIPEIASYTTYGGLLNPLDPASWPIMDATLATYPYLDPLNPSVPVGIEANSINVSGFIAVTGSSVTAAIINQLNPLGYGTFQSATVTSDLVAGNPAINGIVGSPPGTNNGPLNPLVWIYNAATNQLNHQAGGGSTATSSNVGTCVTLPGSTGFTGQCRQLSGALNASGELGGTNIGNSIWNWNGMAANYTVRDSASTPWHAATGTSTTGGLVISGAAGHQGVTWDLSGLVDGVGGTITARVVADVLTGNSSTGISGLYTLQVAVIPVPGAVWMLGAALGVLGIARRRQT